MDFRAYKDIVRYTFSEEYPLYFLEMFIQKLQNKGLIYNDKRKGFNKELLNLTTLNNSKEKINYLFENLNEMVKKCEEFEYERAYRYSYIYKIKEFNIETVYKLIDAKKVVLFTNDNQSNDILDIQAPIPTCRIDDHNIIFKFNFGLKSKVEEDTNTIKHVVLAIINTKLGTFEIRQDVIPIRYQKSEDFYTDRVKEIRAWIISSLECKLVYIDFQAIVKYMKSNKKSEVRVTAMKIERDGMVAELDSAKNTNLNLPILDELRQKIYSEEIFDMCEETRKIRKMLEEFIVDIEENSLLPAAKILWKNKNYELSSYHDKVEGQEGFLKWNKSLKDKESMDYVAEYFIKCERELIESLDD